VLGADVMMNPAVKTGLIVLLCVAIYPLSLVADSSNRFEEGAKRCLNQYLQLAERNNALNDAFAAEEERSYRCLERYESTLPRILAAKKKNKKKKIGNSKKTLNDRIKAIEKAIKRLRKKAGKLEVIAPIKFGKTWDRIWELEAKLEKLLDRIGQGKCTPKKTKINMVFDNNSDYAFVAYLLTNKGTVVELGRVEAGKVKSFSLTLKKLQSYVVPLEKLVQFELVTTIGQIPTKAVATMTLNNMPAKQPCAATARFEVFDKDFPKPNVKYYVFGVKAGSGLHYFIGLEDTVASEAPCDFIGGGNDCDSKVGYDILTPGGYSTYDYAQQGFCYGIKEHEYWQFTSCPNRYKWSNGQWYWACEGSVQSAIEKHCKDKF
ncbi:hypothetical protein OAO01_09125, partial [Oligoflexia bacterium]|nr:hypothetical protein [Oligoflexia bacterium]